MVAGEWEVLPPRPDGELVSIFDYVPGGIARPDEELMRKEKEELLGEFKAGFEATLESGVEPETKIKRKIKKRKELVEVFGRVWDGEKRREVAAELEARKNPATSVARVKALRAQLRRRLARFGAEARGAVAEMLEGVKEGEA